MSDSDSICLAQLLFERLCEKLLLQFTGSAAICRQHLQHGAVTQPLTVSTLINQGVNDNRLPQNNLVKSINISLIIYFCHHQRNEMEPPLAAHHLASL